jgi:hypothetical protein
VTGSLNEPIEIGAIVVVGKEARLPINTTLHEMQRHAWKVESLSARHMDNPCPQLM